MERADTPEGFGLNDIDLPASPARRFFLKNILLGAGAILTSQLPQGRVSAGNLDYETEYERQRQANLTAPSAYKVHMFRSYSNIADISLETIRHVGVIFWPKGETPKQDSVQAPFERMFARVGRFWEREFLNRTVIRTEVLPYIFQGEKFAKDYPNFEPILKELKKGFEKQVEDPLLRNKLIEVIERKGNYKISSSEEFFSLSGIIMNGETSVYPTGGYGSLGLSYLPAWLDDVLREGHIANLIAHETGHSFGLPDQYPFYPPSLPNRWEDSDPRNIMGISAAARPLEQQHMAKNVRTWMLNHQNRKLVPIVSR